MPFVDHPSNPVLGPRWWSWLVGDPSVLEPHLTPDGTWRLFANQVTGIYQYTSVDGVHWGCLGCVDHNGNRPWVIRSDGRYYLYYQAFQSFWQRSRIVLRESDDLVRWGPARSVLDPEHSWEGQNVSNACVFPQDGSFWMYYSADLVYLEDMGFSEPRYISRARAESPRGPFKKHGVPVLGPEEGHAWRGRGAGALKVYGDLMPGWLTGFNNGIFRDAKGRSSSAILLMRSRDGLLWEEYPGNPIIAPTDGWKRAHVYQLDVRRVGRELWMWYNARDGWRFGVERIGLAVLDDADQLWAPGEDGCVHGAREGDAPLLR